MKISLQSFSKHQTFTKLAKFMQVEKYKYQLFDVTFE